MTTDATAGRFAPASAAAGDRPHGQRRSCQDRGGDLRRGAALYSDLAPWWLLISAPAEYAEEAAEAARHLASASKTVREVLELGSGGGNNATHLKRWFELTLVDRSAEMIAVSRQLNPECHHVVGDMRSVRLGRSFDAVFIHDAIGYLVPSRSSWPACRRRSSTAGPGGSRSSSPMPPPRRGWSSTDHGGHDAPDGRAARYLEWDWDPDPTDTETTVEYTFLLRERDGAVHSVHETHRNGLFPTATWASRPHRRGVPSVDGDRADRRRRPGPSDHLPRTSPSRSALTCGFAGRADDVPAACSTDRRAPVSMGSARMTGAEPGAADSPDADRQDPPNHMSRPSHSTSTATSAPSGLVIVANRLPVTWSEQRSTWVTSPGGLVTAVRAAMSTARIDWIGWSGTSSPLASFEHEGWRLHPVTLSDADVDGYYNGFSNATLWPLYHDAIFPSSFDHLWWATYVEVNEHFADRVARVAPMGATVWVHDYQLQLVPQLLRARRPDLRIGFFLHIPFPSQELFLRLPWREEITRGLLGADVVGFQTAVGAENLRLVARRLLGVRHTGQHLAHDGRQVLVARFPVGIDAGAIAELAAEPGTVRRTQQIRRELGSPTTVLLGVDRMDYTKGITIRLAAYRELLEEGRIDPSTTVLVQIAQPTRGDVPGYADVREEVERIVGGINGDFGRLGGIAVKYLHQGQPFEELVALYSCADVMLVTPLRDGMNLIAKEYVAARRNGDGTLILSEFAGAAHELTHAVLVNPYDVERLKAAIAAAVSGEGRMARRDVRALARTVRRQDARTWATTFLQALAPD